MGLKVFAAAMPAEQKFNNQTVLHLTCQVESRLAVFVGHVDITVAMNQHGH